MMAPMTREMKNLFEKMNDREKIRMFYELAVYINKNTEISYDPDMQTLFDDIANVVQDINKL